MGNKELVQKTNEKIYRSLLKCASVFACLIAFVFILVIVFLLIVGIVSAFSGSNAVASSNVTVKSDMVIPAKTVIDADVAFFINNILVAIMFAVGYAIALGFTCFIAIASENFENKIVDYLVGRRDLDLGQQHLNSKVRRLHRYQLLKLTKLFFSTNTQKDVFVPIMADWDKEFFDAIQNNDKTFMITTRNSYAFLVAILIKSPIGDLVDFIRKFWK